MVAGGESYRVVYEIDDAEHLVIVHRIAHRATVYRPAERTDGTPRSRSSQLDGVVQDVSRDA